MTRKDPLFHLTPVRNAKAILRDGLKADEDGYIYLFTDMVVANSIARDQVFTKRYTVFVVDRKGLKGRVRQDQVAEFTRPYLRRVKQDCIQPEFLQKTVTCNTVFDHPLAWDYFVEENLRGWSGEQTDEWRAIKRLMDKKTPADKQMAAKIDREINRRIKKLYGTK